VQPEPLNGFRFIVGLLEDFDDCCPYSSYFSLINWNALIN
jgi:hypothetical protein